MYLDQKSHDWRIKPLFNNAVQERSLKESFQTKTETLDTEAETNGDTHLSPNLLCRLLFSSRRVLAECEGLGRHGGPVLPASAETAAETRLGQRGRQRHRLAFRASFRL